MTDTTGGRLGNKERMAFLYHKKKVRFAKLSGEIISPDGQTVVGSANIYSVDNELYLIDVGGSYSSLPVFMKNHCQSRNMKKGLKLTYPKK